MNEKITHVTAAILCGGKSRRMGFDKAFLRDGEHYLLLNTVRELRFLFERVVLVSNTKAKFEAQSDFRDIPVLEDIYTEQGPLGGISSALLQVDTEYIFVIACDMPLSDISLIARMYQRLGQKQVLACSHQGILEPLFAFYHRSCLPVFRKQLGEGNRKPRSAFPSLEVGVYALSGGETKNIVNLNTPEDIQKWKPGPLPMEITERKEQEDGYRKKE